MKTQLFKLYFAALVIGIAAAGSAFAQQKLNFDVPFDFQIGSEKLSAGKYEMRVLDHKKYVLRNLETKKSMLVVPDSMTAGESLNFTEKIVFNRYDDTYFLREIYTRRGTGGHTINESKTEKNLRRGNSDDHRNLAEKRTAPEQVSVNSARK